MISYIHSFQNELCRFHSTNHCPQLNCLATSQQEHLNSLKNNLRLRSTCTQRPERHLFYNIGMDLRENANRNFLNEFSGPGGVCCAYFSFKSIILSEHDLEISNLLLFLNPPHSDG